MNKQTLRLRTSAFAILAAFCVAAPAMAQDSPEDDAGFDEIIVTAQKRSESVQTVPISIAAFNEETLERANVVTILDLGRVATNFQSVRSSNTGSTRIGIRGVG